MAKWLESQHSNPWVTGSIPSWGQAGLRKEEYFLLQTIVSPAGKSRVYREKPRHPDTRACPEPQAPSFTPARHQPLICTSD